MGLANNLKKQVDLPVWEWTRFAPTTPTAGLSCTCVADNTVVNENNGRYIYYLFSASNFWRYDTVSDTWQQLATPIQVQSTATSIRFAGAQGYSNRVLSATTNTIRTGLPAGRAAIGYKIRITSGTGAGQERIITDVSDPIVADFGTVVSSTTTSITDTTKNWFGTAAAANLATSGAYTNTIANVNGWAGYVVRFPFYNNLIAGIPYGNNARKILYNNPIQLVIGDPNIGSLEPFSNVTFPNNTAIGVGANYQIESSTITVNDNWDTTPDATSRFMIHSGAIWLNSFVSNAALHYMSYYDILNDTWYAMPALSNIIQAAPTENSLERMTENATIWHRGKASSGSTTSLVQLDANWNKDEWVGYEVYIFSGTGRGQITAITGNTDTTLVFAALGTAPDSTSRFEIIGYDGGTSSGSNTYITLNDTTKTWDINRWKNYSIRILHGTGRGQKRRIASNTSNSITIARGWDVLPTNTSVYVIEGDSDTMLISWGGSAETYQYTTAKNTMFTHHGRFLDGGTASILAALRCDSNHTIHDAQPIALTSLSGTTTITATSTHPHCLKVGDWVSIRGVTSAAADQYNVTGAYQVTEVPDVTRFRYTPAAAGTGTYAYLSALGVNNLVDASADFRDNVSSATTSSITFTRATPSNINGWYITGTNITPGTRVTSGAGTVTVSFPTQGGTPAGVITFSKWGPTTPITSTYSSGGGNGVATITMTGNTNANINGWYVSGTNIPANTFVTSGAGTATIVLSNACTGVVSGTITFYPPELAGKMVVMMTAAPTVLAGLATATLQMAISPSGYGTGFLGSTVGGTPAAGISRYAICDVPVLGANFEGNTNDYIYGISSAGSASGITDPNAFWLGTTATGSAQGTTLSLSATAPGSISGWYITGVNVASGAKIIGGAGTTSLTVNIPHAGTVNGQILCCAYAPSGFNFSSPLASKRIKVLSGTGPNQETVISGIQPQNGTILFAANLSVATASNSVYTIISNSVKGPGHELSWTYGDFTATSGDRGKFLWSARGGTVIGFDKINLTTDKVHYVNTTPFSDVFAAGSYFAYDGHNKIYFNYSTSLQRLYSIDVTSGFVHGAGFTPYTAGTAGIGNKMEVFQTVDGLDYLFVNRHANQEHFRALLYY